jgi:ribonuclease BN (tRNA processing enzyme)
MKLRVLGPYGGDMPGCFMSAFLINECLLVDAGTIGQVLDLKDQLKIRDVLISHSHLDHCNALPFFAVNVFSNDAPPIYVYALQPTLDAIQNHILNNQVWPDFTKIKKPNGTPVFELRKLLEKDEVKVGNFQVLPVRVNHPVVTSGFVIMDGGKSLVYTADTGITDDIWEAANDAPNLRGLITEVSYPNKMQKLADTSGHLTPGDLKRELGKIRRRLDIPVYIYHMKPEYDAEIRKEIKELRIPNIELLKTGKTYDL